MCVSFFLARYRPDNIIYKYSLDFVKDGINMSSTEMLAGIAQSV
jgi:hypothetical protein